MASKYLPDGGDGNEKSLFLVFFVGGEFLGYTLGLEPQRVSVSQDSTFKEVSFPGTGAPIQMGMANPILPNFMRINGRRDQC